MAAIKFLPRESSQRLVVYILLIVMHLQVVKLFKPAPHNVIFEKEPNIWLKGYQKVDSLYLVAAETEFRFQHQVQNEFVSKNGSDFVISESVSTVDFTCEAQYPITWHFPFRKQIPIDVSISYALPIEEYRISEWSPDMPEPVNIRYKTVIRISLFTVNFFSANLTCKSAEESKLDMETSIHVFLKGKNEIENQKETLQVFAEKFNYIYGRPPASIPPPLLLPCRPATPDIKLMLQMETVDGAHGDLIQKKTWQPLIPQLQENLSFDPKVGFTLRRNTYGNIVYGLYKCSVITTSNDDVNELTTENEQFVLVNVTMVANNTLSNNNSNEPNPAFTFKTRSVLHGKATADMENPSRKQFDDSKFVCCSGDQSKPPKLYLKYCDNAVQCNLLKDSILEAIVSEKVKEDEALKHLLKNLHGDKEQTPKECRKENLYGQGSIVVVCQGENVDFVEHFLLSFDPLANGSVANRTDRVLQTSNNPKVEDKVNPTRRVNEYVPLSKYEPAKVLESEENVAKTIMLFVGQSFASTKLFYKFIHGRSNHRRIAAYGLANYLQNADIDDAYSTELFDEAVSRISRAIIHIAEYPRDYYYEGEQMLFICIGLKYVFAKGAYIRLTWKNGTKSVLTETASKMDTTKVHQMEALRALHLNGGAYLNVGLGSDYRPTYGTTILATIETNSVDCLMPRRNSKKWDKISKEIKVLPGCAPMFAEKEEETKIFYVGDVGNIIACTLQQGTPSPSITVTRNGKNLRVSFRETNQINSMVAPKKGTNQEGLLNENGDVTAIKIYFAGIEHSDHESVFQCIAENINKTTPRTIRILVKEKSGTGILLPVTLSCMAALLFILAALGVKYYYKKRNVRFSQRIRTQ